MNFFMLGQSALNSPAVLGKSGSLTKYHALIYQNGTWHYFAPQIAVSADIQMRRHGIIIFK